MRVICETQGTPEWLRARSGRITASRIVDVLDVLKRGGESAKRYNYRMELLAERLTGRVSDSYVSPEMQWGQENEEIARAEYEIAKGVSTDQTGFVLHPTLDYTGASPDALGDDNGLEIKCPKTTTHLKWLMANEVPEEHRPQMYWNMVCCERDSWDFMSYDPRLPKDLRCFFATLPRDNAEIERIEQAVTEFHESVDSFLLNLGKDGYWKPSAPASDEPVPEGADYLDQLGDMLGGELML